MRPDAVVAEKIAGMDVATLAEKALGMLHMITLEPHGNDSDQEVADAVLSYLRAHPEAADTLQGIVRWWLPQQRYNRESGRIEAVLTSLAERGRLQVRMLPDGQFLYALSVAYNADRTADLH
ncbi:hypothetical protein QSH18_08375 [Xanthomonas sp. NCPPB 2654]|uniref:hypothetical protein n=1 Tax=unclassified Xanthomonas TaxID=2643310 RepID=UPI0021E074A4|nr:MULTISPECIES: hypothetical protein [unclassified Xanthomonas]MDL5365617.1 hypothetical protein [Xanthomonas sp. NCPPB 2654]MDR6673182.1 hypothetical protein [Xanthomonas translucens]MEB1528087.1 hypothetical protein [Xanthomonas campestris pv. campestris]UYC18762.1 hypothetical protein NUG20_11125 [Xanthomonas sp. CFBP 8443]